MIYYPPMGRKSVEVMKDFRGVSTLDAFTMNESYATVAKNLDADDYPAMKTRKARKKYGTGIVSGLKGIQGIYLYRSLYQANQTVQEIAICNANVYVKDNQTWTEIFSYDLDPNSSAPVATKDWNGTLFDVNGVTNLVLSPGTSPGMFRYNGTSLIAFDPQIAEGILFPKYVTAHGERLYAAVGNSVHASAIANGLDWTTPETTWSSGDTGITDGEMINGLHAGQEKLLIFKPNNMYELYGDLPENYRIIKIAEGIGLINHKCIVDMQGITYFLHTTGIYAYTGGRPRRISDLIQKYIDNMSKAELGDCSIGTDETRLFVQLPQGIMLVWHSEYNVWYEWDGFYARCMLSGNGNILFGSNDSNVYGFTGSTDETSVAWEWVSKPINTGLLPQRLRLNKMWLTAKLESGLIDVYISKQPSGNSDWVKIDTVTALQLVNKKTVINTSVAANAKVLRLKLSGAGMCTIYEILRESKAFPLV